MLNEFIRDIVANKTGKLLDFPENEILFNPYITQRVISMYSPTLCNVINETTNKKLSALSKRELYDLLIAIIPKQNKSFTKFFKKETVDGKLNLSDKDKTAIDFLCSKYNISYREVVGYVVEFDLDVDIF